AREPTRISAAAVARRERELHRQAALELGVPHPQHDAHAAAADGLLDAVAPERAVAQPQAVEQLAQQRLGLVALALERALRQAGQPAAALQPRVEGLRSAPAIQQA